MRQAPTTRLLAIAAAVSGSLLWAEQPAQGQALSLTLVNRADESLEELYITPSDSEDFGDNRLSRPLAAGASRTITINDDQACLYDILGFLSSDAEVVDYEIDICSINGGEYTLFDPDNPVQDLLVFNGTADDLVELRLVVDFLEEDPFIEDSLEIEDDFGDFDELEEALGELAALEELDAELPEFSEFLLGNIILAPQEQVLLTTGITALDCQEALLVATFEGQDGLREETRDIDLCTDDTVVFGDFPAGNDLTITVQNATDDLVLWEFYATPPDSDDWGYDLLETEVVDPSSAQAVSIFSADPDTCIFDVRAVFVEPKSFRNLEPVDWFEVNLCELENQTLIYGLPPTVSNGDRRMTRESLEAAFSPEQRSKAGLKQISRRKSRTCLSRARSRVCQPARKTRSSTVPWWARRFRRP